MVAATSAEVFIIHDDGDILYADEMFRTLVGAAAGDELVGTAVTELVAERCRDPLRSQIERIEAGESPALGLSVTLQPFSGRSREVIAVSSPVDWEGTERVQTSFLTASDTESPGQAVRESALHEAPIGIAISDPSQSDNPLVYVNDGFLELTGYPREEVLGRNCRFLQGEKTRPEPVDRIRAAIDAQQPVTAELRNYRKDGSMFWNRVSIVPVSSDSGELSHFVGFQQDITDTKLYEYENTLFKKQAEVADQAMLITDRDGVIEYVNPAFERITGYSASDAIGQTPRILKSEAQDDAFYEHLWETITAGEIWEGELTNKTRSGQRYTVRQTIVPITDDRGEITHFAAIEDDITNQKLRNQTLAVLNRVLRHNLRTAINVIDAHAGLLEGDLSEAEFEGALAAIRKQTTAMKKIDDRAATIRTIWDREGPSHVWEIPAIRTVVDRLSEAYPHAKITLHIEITDSVSLPDAELFEIAFQEAVENAIVHAETETPTVEITVRRDDGSDEVIVSVADDGPGIPETEREIIETGRETPLTHGSGIGLWIMEWVTTSLGGRLELPETDSGATVAFQLPTVERQDATDDWSSIS